MQDRKDASQKQNKRIKKQATLQNRKKQESVQREKRKRDLLALTFGGHQEQGGRLGGRHTHHTDSSDDILSADKRLARQAHHHHNHHQDIANVHGHTEDVATRQRREEAERLERVRQVEQTTVHTVITTHEKIHNSQAGTRHLPAVAAGRQSDPLEHVHVHAAAKTAGGLDHDRERPVRGAVGDQERDHSGRGGGGVGGGGRSGSITGSGSDGQNRSRHSGVPHLRSLMKADCADARAGQN